MGSSDDNQNHFHIKGKTENIKRSGVYDSLLSGTERPVYVVSIGNCGAHAVDIKQLLLLFHNVISTNSLNNRACIPTDSTVQWGAVDVRFGVRWLCGGCAVDVRWMCGRASNYPGRGPRFETNCCRFETCTISFTPLCLCFSE